MKFSIISQHYSAQSSISHLGAKKPGSSRCASAQERILEPIHNWSPRTLPRRPSEGKPVPRLLEVGDGGCRECTRSRIVGDLVPSASSTSTRTLPYHTLLCVVCGELRPCASRRTVSPRTTLPRRGAASCQKQTMQQTMQQTTSTRAVGCGCEEHGCPSTPGAVRRFEEGPCSVSLGTAGARRQGSNPLPGRSRRSSTAGSRRRRRGCTGLRARRTGRDVRCPPTILSAHRVSVVVERSGIGKGFRRALHSRGHGSSSGESDSCSGHE